MVSLASVLGSGLPLGKEGPVMHMASIVATMLTKTLRYIKGTMENDARSIDLLAAASTMGVAVSYAAPIGGESPHTLLCPALPPRRSLAGHSFLLLTPLYQ